MDKKPLVKPIEAPSVKPKHGALHGPRKPNWRDAAAHTLAQAARQDSPETQPDPNLGVDKGESVSGGDSQEPVKP